NALVELDPHNSSFIYRRTKEGQTQLVKMVSLPSLEDIDRDMQKIEESRLLEGIRAEAVAGRSSGVVLFNEALPVGGHLEIGPLLRNPEGQLLGAGVASGSQAMARAFELINHLRVPDRARLQANHFAATAVELDRDGAEKQTVFLTIEFPLGEARQERTNHL